MSDVEPKTTASDAAAPVAETAPSTDVVMDSAETAPTNDEEEKKLMQAAASQMEFYFADANLPYDKFMWTLYSADPVNHWVALSVITSFKRMRPYTSRGLPFILSSLKTFSPTTLELSPDETQIRRIAPLVEPKNLFDRSIYAKGFPLDISQEKLEEFFKAWGGVDAVRMRRDAAKKFKGSVFVEWKEFETVAKFLEAEPKPSWDGKELLIMTKEAYCDMKTKEKGLSGRAADNRKDYLKTKGFNAFREMAAASSTSTSSPSTATKNSSDKKFSTEKKTPEIVLEFMGVRIPVIVGEDGNGTVDESAVPTVEGATLKFTGCGGDVTWASIKDPLKEHFPRPPYIKYSRGDDFGYVGFSAVLSEEDIAYVKENVKIVNSNEVSWVLADAEESKTVLIERAKFAAKAALASQTGGSSSRGGGRGGRGGRGGGRDNNSRGGGRGGRGGRGRGRGGKGDRGDRNAERQNKSEGAGGEEGVGEKRKRAVEPDGGPDVGVRGKTGPPVIGTAGASKKAKVDGEA